MPIGPTELLIVLFVFGAGKLPEVGAALGRSVREFRKGFREERAEAEPGATGESRGR